MTDQPGDHSKNPERILITGATGMLGRALVHRLERKGIEAVSLSRRPGEGPNAVSWDPDRDTIETEKLRGISAVVHLAGENIADGRWSRSRKQRILESRKRGTDLLVRTLLSLEPRPSVLISASGINYYGNCGDTIVTEKDGAGTGFLADVCREWESATDRAAQAGIRVVRLRIGPVLSPEGGLLKKVLPPFRAGVGGRIGNGKQYMSWIAIDDLLRIMEFCLNHENVSGPVNAVAPEPVTNAEFTRILASVVSRPAVLPVPAAGLRLLFGEMADEMLLASTRAQPQKLQESGFTFNFPQLKPALEHLLQRPKSSD